MKVQAVDIAVVGAGFAGTCAAHALAASGARIALIDRVPSFPDLFRAEKIEPDQAEIMRELGVLDLRAPAAPVIGTIINYDGRDAVPFDTGEQYGISYSETVNKLRSRLPGAVSLIFDGVEKLAPEGPRPEVALRDHGTLQAGLIVIATGGSDAILESLGLRRSYDRSLVSLSFGFDIERADGGALVSRGFNYYVPRGPARIDYVTIFPIGQRMRVNLFTQLDPKHPLVGGIKSDAVGALREHFPGLSDHVGDVRLASRVQVVPTVYHRLADPVRPGVVIIGDEFQSVSPTTGTGLSRALTDVRVLARHAARWGGLGSVPPKLVRAFYADREKAASDRRALGAWMYYHNKMLADRTPLRRRIRQELTLRRIGRL